MRLLNAAKDALDLLAREDLHFSPEADELRAAIAEAEASESVAILCARELLEAGHLDIDVLARAERIQEQRRNAPVEV